MQELKKTMVGAFFCIEIFVFIFLHTFGTHGIQALQYLVQESDALREKNAQIRKDIEQLEYVCENHEYALFYKEKIARERLQMAHQDDVVYYVD